MMTAKDFQAIAQALRDAREALSLLPELERYKVEVQSAINPTAMRRAQDEVANAEAQQARITRSFDSLARSVADTLRLQSPKFDRARFLREAGVE